MNMLRSQPAASDASTYARTPFSRQTPSLQTVQACTPTRNPGPMTDWWRRHAKGNSPRRRTARSSDATETLVGDTVAAFRAALEQSDDVESAADLPSAHRADDDNSESLDYFAPAFRQALGDEDRASSADRSDGTAPDSAASPAESLDYFGPAFHRALDANESAAEASADQASHDTEVSAPRDEAPAESLDYFAPAFRQALGARDRPAAESSGREMDAERTAPGAVRRFKEAVQDVSEESLKRLADLNLSGTGPSSLDLDGVAERFFAAQSRELVAVNGR